VSRPFLETPHLPSIYLFRQPVRRRHDRSRGIVNPAFPTLVKRKGDSPRSSAGRAGSLSAAPAGTSGCRRDYPPAGAGRPRLAAPPPARPPGGPSIALFSPPIYPSLVSRPRFSLAVARSLRWFCRAPSGLCWQSWSSLFRTVCLSSLCANQSRAAAAFVAATFLPFPGER
jgi:hypothetical protein